MKLKLLRPSVSKKALKALPEWRLRVYEARLGSVTARELLGWVINFVERDDGPPFSEDEMVRFVHHVTRSPFISQSVADSGALRAKLKEAFKTMMDGQPWKLEARELDGYRMYTKPGTVFYGGPTGTVFLSASAD